MPQFAFDPDPFAVSELQKLPADNPVVVFDPGNPEYELAIVIPIPRGYGGHVLRLVDHLHLVDQEPAVSAEPGAELLRRYLLQIAQT